MVLIHKRHKKAFPHMNSILIICLIPESYRRILHLSFQISVGVGGGGGSMFVLVIFAVHSAITSSALGGQPKKVGLDCVGTKGESTHFFSFPPVACSH